MPLCKNPSPGNLFARNDSRNGPTVAARQGGCPPLFAAFEQADRWRGVAHFPGNVASRYARRFPQFAVRFARGFVVDDAAFHDAVN